MLRPRTKICKNMRFLGKKNLQILNAIFGVRVLELDSPRKSHLTLNFLQIFPPVVTPHRRSGIFCRTRFKIWSHTSRTAKILIFMTKIRESNRYVTLLAPYYYNKGWDHWKLSVSVLGHVLGKWKYISYFPDTVSDITERLDFRFYSPYYGYNYHRNLPK